MDTEWSRSRRHDDDSVVLLYYLYGDALAREYDLPRPPPVRLDPNGRMSFDVGGWGNGGEGIGGGGGGGGGGRPHNGSGSGSSSTPLQDGTTISSNSGGGGGGGADETEFGMADISTLLREASNKVPLFFTSRFLSAAADVVDHLAGNNFSGVNPQTKNAPPPVDALPQADPAQLKSGEIQVALALSRDFSRLDAAVLRLGAVADPQRLGVALAEIGDDELGKARAIYSWIVNNIEYDVVRFQGVLSGRGQPKMSAKQILQGRKGVCADYAELFCALASYCNLRSESIAGEAAMPDGMVFPRPGANHAWNVVMIEAQWYLIDATWGAGSLEGSQWTKKATYDWFLTSPHVFMCQHYPTIPAWQLMPNPLDYNTWKSLPKLFPPFFRYRMDLLSHSNGTIECSSPGSDGVIPCQKGRITVSLRAPQGCTLLAQIGGVNAGPGPSRTCTLRRGDEVKVLVACDYGDSSTSETLSICVGITQSDGRVRAEGAVQYMLKRCPQQHRCNRCLLPYVYPQFGVGGLHPMQYDGGCDLLSVRLSKEPNVRGQVYVVQIDGSNKVRWKQELVHEGNGIFTGQVSRGPKAGELVLAAMTGRSFKFLAHYRVS